LERGNINALFLADGIGGYDTYGGSLDESIKRAAEWPITDPTIVSSGEHLRLIISELRVIFLQKPISAMASGKVF
jgi:hypothetical protein